MSNDTASNTTQETPKDNKIMCPCCREMTLSTPIKVPDPLLDHYMSCIMSGVPFWHEYPLYGGKILVKVSLLGRDYQALYDRLVRLATRFENKIKDTDTPHTINTLRTLVSNYLHITQVTNKLTSVSAKQWQPAEVIAVKLNTELDAIEKADDVEVFLDKTKLLLDFCRDENNVSGLPEALLSVAIDTHRRLHGILVASGIDANFWDGIELV